jgi:LysM repeat protein
VNARAIAVWGLLALATTARAAGDAAGTAAGSFLAVGTGTSVLSMAGATLASGNDLAAASWNVASLARVDALQFSLAHSPLPGGATQDWLAGGGRLGSGATRWGLQALFHREGEIEGRDAANNPTGSLSANDLALGASLAQPLGAHVTAGLGAEWLHESLAGTSGSGLGFSAGLRADAGPLGFALAARHLGGTMRYPDAKYDLPQVVAGGVSWTDVAHGLRVNADLEAPAHYYTSARVGGEWLWRDRLAVRAGYRLAMGAPSDATTSGPAFGIGAGVGSMWMDYAFLLDGGTDSGEHRIGLTFHPGFPGMGGAARGERTTVETAPRREVERPVERAKPVVATPAVTAPAVAKASTSSPPAATPPSDKPKPKPAAPTPAAPPAAATAPVSRPGPPPEVVAARPTWIVVAPGETLDGIAKRWGTTVTAIMETNNLVNDRVAPGQQLRLPPTSPR